tara:strand:- start:299 stop:601 length:303 start_codon:yes stop_codon:yes gene_type:complete
MNSIVKAHEQKNKMLDLFEISTQSFLEEARAVAKSLVAEKGLVTVNDVRNICPPPDHIDPRVMGAIFRTGLKSEWEMVGYIASARAHARPIGQFKLKEIL